MPSKARERGLGYRFTYLDENGFEYALCIDQNGMAVPVADSQGHGEQRGGGHGEMGGGIMMGGVMEAPAAGPQGAGNMMGGGMMGGSNAMAPGHIDGGHRRARYGEMGEGIRMGLNDIRNFEYDPKLRGRANAEQWMRLSRQMREHDQRGQGHGQPFAQQQAPDVQQAPADGSDRPPFVNPFKTALPQGSYGKRGYVAGQEAIEVSDHGRRYDDPYTSWNMLRSLEQLRRQNGGG
ncbi:hypothetical protein G6011_01056 [Alternaria panax]|uniref:Uncharacterized protein n=1 Tax=Alternaria panax TaxID=48097 RepID=A0AAD4IK42_9PLEO|nr:hypothetical protein G6011_01056 [Alternaria panax]